MKAGRKLCPEPLAHDTVDAEVDAGVEDDEDGVEVLHAIPQYWDRRVPCSCASSYPEMNVISDIIRISDI